MAEIATTLAPPQVAHLTEAALGCFKDGMLHLLTKKRVDFQIGHLNGALSQGLASFPNRNTTCLYTTRRPGDDDEGDTIQKIKLSVSRAMQNPSTLLSEPSDIPSNKPWTMVSIGEASDTFAETYTTFPATISGFPYGPSSYVNDGDGAPWNQSICTESTHTGADQQVGLQGKGRGEDEDEGKSMRKESDVFSSDCVLWDVTDDLMNPAA